MAFSLEEAPTFGQDSSLNLSEQQDAMYRLTGDKIDLRMCFGKGIYQVQAFG